MEDSRPPLGIRSSIFCPKVEGVRAIEGVAEVILINPQWPKSAIFKIIVANYASDKLKIEITGNSQFCPTL
jgi:hypothetical protein